MKDYQCIFYFYLIGGNTIAFKSVCNVSNICFCSEPISFFLNFFFQTLDTWPAFRHKIQHNYLSINSPSELSHKQLCGPSSLVPPSVWQRLQKSAPKQSLLWVAGRGYFALPRGPKTPSRPLVCWTLEGSRTRGLNFLCRPLGGSMR